ncbi:MAG: pyridoxamine 5'-phosphate oxidase family protein [Chloroflexota bacterium]|nr:pyridoxamine 5'-phosphate oxidase family protein [Chloroflexota bacterium]
MVKITEEMKSAIEKQKVVVIATVNEAREPNVVPIAYKKVLSENELLLMNNFMRKTEENLKMNPNVAVSVWYTDSSGSSKGYQLKGKARIETSGKIFNEGIKMVQATGSKLIPKSAVIINVDSIYSISPGSGAGEQIG